MRFAILFILALTFFACPMANAQTPQSTEQAENVRPLPVYNVLVGYALYENFGGKATIGATVIQTDGVNNAAQTDRIYNDLLAKLTEEGKLDKVKDLSNPKKAWIDITSIDVIRPNLKYTSRKLLNAGQ